MKFKKLRKELVRLFKEKYYVSRYLRSSPGTANWLIASEIKFGGKTTNVPRNKVSFQDPRSKQEINCGGMTGGDRMLDHGYAPKYSEYLLPFVKSTGNKTVVEFGILKGTGLAIWSRLFKTARILGFDIDLEHTNKNIPNLKKLGAFKHREPELYEFDQFLDNKVYLGKILGDNKIDICIDDGFHSNESILTTMNSVYPYLADEFVYFIEDNDMVHEKIRELYPELKVESQGELTIVTNL